MSPLIFKKHLTIMSILSVLFMLLVFIQPMLLRDNRTSCSKQTLGRLPYKTVLLYTPLHQEFAHWDVYFRRIIQGACSESRCRFTSNKSELSSSDAVLFSAFDLPLRTLLDAEDLAKRKAHQPWVFFSMDPPTSIPLARNLLQYNNFFNWTMTYKEDSDIVSPYGFVFPKPRLRDQNSFLVGVGGQAVDISTTEFLSRENLAVTAWSSCRRRVSSGKRMIKELSLYMKIDAVDSCDIEKAKYGNLGTVYLKKYDILLDNIQNYYFYLAFETSICPDYVTENFYLALRLGVVPVVLDAVPNPSHLPPNSYINAKDFKDTKHLAEYLKSVSESREIYLKYHEWRQDFDINIGFPLDPQPCDLCAKLYEKNEPKVYENMGEWFSKSSCRR